jgi:hypothetical protein
MVNGSPNDNKLPGGEETTMILSSKSSNKTGTKASDADVRWLILAYRVPNEPTRLRAAVWRKLKSLGAIYLLNGTALFPFDPSAERTLRALRREIIEDMGGTAVLFYSDPVAGGTEVVSQFNVARNDEYEEIVDRCQDFLAGLEKEIISKHHTFAELEEDKEDFVKLQRWFEKVRARDLLNAEGAQTAIDILALCSKMLEDYADEVYRRAGN